MGFAFCIKYGLLNFYFLITLLEISNDLKIRNSKALTLGN